MQSPCEITNPAEVTTLPFLMLAETDLEKHRRQTFWYKEPETIAWIDSFADGDTFWDVGANVGIYSLYCAAMHPHTTIHAFEPHRGNFAHLRQNALINNFWFLHPHHCAILDHGATDIFYEPPREEIGASGGQAEVARSDSHVHYPVWVTSLDALTEPFGVPQHVKIDIDGQELRVVLGMANLLQERGLRSVLIEVDLTQHHERDAVCGIFFAAGFDMLNPFNTLPNHSRHRRAKEGIHVENVIFTRRG